MKRILSLVFAAAMLLSLLAACSGTGKTETPKTAETVTMTDNAGREVTVPAEVTRVAPSGTVATMFLASVCPDYLVCIGSENSDAQAAYLPKALASLPVTGQLYGGKSTINLEALLAAKPQIIIDLGQLAVAHESCNLEHDIRDRFIVRNDCDAAVNIDDSVDGKGDILLVGAHRYDIVGVVGEAGGYSTLFKPIALDISHADVPCVLVALNDTYLQNILLCILADNH